MLDWPSRVERDPLILDTHESETAHPCLTMVWLQRSHSRTRPSRSCDVPAHLLIGLVALSECANLRYFRTQVADNAQF